MNQDSRQKDLTQYFEESFMEDSVDDISFEDNQSKTTDLVMTNETSEAEQKATNQNVLNSKCK
jgi:hypothetical protein